MRIDREAETLVVEVASEEETDRVGRAIAAAIQPGVVVGLEGPLGAGKTRLSRAIAEALGVDPGAIASPTFVLIHEYEGRLPVYHFDTYRLDDPEAFDALGVDDYFSGIGICLVEWADRVADRLPPGSWRVRIEPTSPQGRRLHLRASPASLDRMTTLLKGSCEPSGAIDRTGPTT